MPLYEYRCDACGERFELIQKFSDPPPAACTKCGKGPVVRLVSSPAIQFKGTGWYITDYAQKGKSGAESPAGGSDGKGTGESKGDGASSGSAGASETASKSETTSKAEPAAASSTSKPSSGT